jgi:hypothetical protein
MVSLARSRTTFRLNRTIRTRKLVGRDGRLAWYRHGRPALTPVSLFQEARAFVCGLGLNSQSEWRDCCKMAPINASPA